MKFTSEISLKIRTAIKVKLAELGNDVYEELPDYIMVMVANKKSEEQMTEDLALFLGDNTDKFTSWLHSLLNRLQSVTSDSMKKKCALTKVEESSSATFCELESDQSEHSNEDVLCASPAPGSDEESPSTSYLNCENEVGILENSTDRTVDADSTSKSTKRTLNSGEGAGDSDIKCKLKREDRKRKNDCETRIIRMKVDRTDKVVNTKNVFETPSTQKRQKLKKTK